MKKFLLSLVGLTLGLTGFVTHAQTESVAYECLFGTGLNNQNVSSYTNSWTVTNKGFTWDIVNFNNNNSGWDYVKCGNTSADLTGTITTQSAIPIEITKVVINVGAITATMRLQI